MGELEKAFTNASSPGLVDLTWPTHRSSETNWPTSANSEAAAGVTTLYGFSAATRVYFAKDDDRDDKDRLTPGEELRWLRNAWASLGGTEEEITQRVLGWIG